MTTSLVNHAENVSLARREREKIGHWWKALITIGQTLVVLTCFLIFLEGYFRLAGVGEQEFIQPDLNMGCRHIPTKKVIWRLEGYSNDKLSSVGLRDTEHALPKPAGTYRIALLGDSAVESLQVGMNETFGKVLEKLLNAQLNKKVGKNPLNTIQHFEVINFGCSSYSTGQEVLQYEREVDKYSPDIVVLLYNRGDSLENIVKVKDRKRAEARPYFYIDTKTGHLKEDNSVLLANADKLKPDIIKEFLRKNSAIYGVFTQADLSLSLNEPRYCKLKNWWQALLNLPNKIKGKKPMVSNANYADQNDMAVTEALLSCLADETKEKKRQFVLAMFPNIVHFNELKEQAAALKTLAQQKKFQYLDLSNSFLACKDPKSNFLQYHFSKQGHAVVAYDLRNLIDHDIKSGSFGIK